MLSIGRSLAVVLSQNKMIYDLSRRPDVQTPSSRIGAGRSFGIANPVWALLILIVRVLRRCCI